MIRDRKLEPSLPFNHEESGQLNFHVIDGSSYLCKMIHTFQGASVTFKEVGPNLTLFEDATILFIILEINRKAYRGLNS